MLLILCTGYLSAAQTLFSDKGKKHIVLSKEISLIKQTKNISNSVLVVEDDYNLAGSVLKIPSNSTLIFKGGSISNGTIDFNHCRIEGDALITCDFTGEIANDYVDIRWFGIKEGDSLFDNGPIINKVCAQYSKVLLPKGVYYFTTPIVILDAKKLEFNGDLIYQGAKNTIAMTITGTTAVINIFGTISCYKNKNVSYSNSKKGSNIVGIDFQNVNNSIIYVNEVKYFNENIRVSGVGGSCCYNQFSFGLIRNANVGLRIYQEDAKNKQGWANENTFTGGRFTNFSDWESKDESYAIKITGPRTNDTYNSVNSLHFTKQSFEGYSTIVYANNVSSSNFLYARVEGSSLFVKFVGLCKNCRISTGYNDGCSLYDDSESKLIPINLNEISQFHLATIDLQNGIKALTNSNGKQRYSSENFAFCNASDAFYGMITTASIDSIGSLPKTCLNCPSINIDATLTKLYRVKLSHPGRVHVVYLEDSKGNNITWNTINKYPMPKTPICAGDMYYNASKHAFVIGTDSEEIIFQVPINIQKIQVRVFGNYSLASIYSYRDQASISYPKIKDSGTSSERPEYAYTGQKYFDTTLCKYICWSGSKWINLDGSNL